MRFPAHAVGYNKVYLGRRMKCVSCEVTWVDDERCWCCGEPGERGMLVRLVSPRRTL